MNFYTFSSFTFGDNLICFPDPKSSIVQLFYLE